MSRRYLLLIVCLVVALCQVCAAAAQPVRRIISTAPSITETLFALGLGDRVVGVSDFCTYPPEAKKRPKIGGLFNPSYEAIVALRPDLVVVLVGRGQLEPQLKKLGLKTMVVDHCSVDGILASFTSIGTRLGKRAKAEQMVADIKRRLDRVATKTAERPRPGVLFSVGRDLGSGRLANVYVAGADPFFDKILPLAGGRNACRGKAAFPKVSLEGILTMNPEVIVDILAPGTLKKHDAKTILADWRQAAGIEAVKRGQVHLLDDDFASIPGPRFILLVEKLARLLHPELDWR